MGRQVKKSGAWREVNSSCVKVDGAWKQVKERWTKVEGVWRKVADYKIIPAAIANGNLFSGTIQAGLLPNGKLGAILNGSANTSGGQIVKAGISITGIRQFAPVSFTLKYTSNNYSSTPVYLTDQYGNQYRGWAYNVTGENVSYSGWNDTEMNIQINVHTAQPIQAELIIENLIVDGKRVF